MSDSLNLQLPYVQEAQAQKHVTVNEALRRLDAVVQLTVLGTAVSAPPGAPSEGDRYIVPADGTAAWGADEGTVMAYLDGAWLPFRPRPGWLAHNLARGGLIQFHDGWREVQLERLGVNAGADATNRLAVASEAVLFRSDPDGPGDVRVVLNKAGSGDAAVQLFQSAYSGRAELGLVGSDDFSLKVSADGAAFHSAFSVGAGDGRVDFAQVPAVAGFAGALSLPRFYDLGGADVPAGVMTVVTRGYAAEGDGGGGRYVRVAALPGDGLGSADGVGGFWALADGTVDVRQAGAVGDGVSDDTGALRKALTSGRTVRFGGGRFRVTGTLWTGGPDQRIDGDGATLVVASDFAGPDGVLAAVFDGLTVSDLSVVFDQGGASSRSALTAYAPAVTVSHRARCAVRAVTITGGTDGIRAEGDCSGLVLDGVRADVFGVALTLGGASGAVRVDGFAADGATLAGDLAAIHGDGAGVGLRLGVLGHLSAQALQLGPTVVETADAGPVGAIHGLAARAVAFDAGDLSVHGLAAAGAGPLVDIAGGSLILAGARLDASAGAAVRVTGGSVSLTGAAIALSDAAADGVAVSGGAVALSANRFALAGDEVRSGACVRQTGGRLALTGCAASARGAGSGAFLDVSAGTTVMAGNDDGGWTVSTP